MSACLIPLDGAYLTMTSREIAELTGKEHRNVMADIRKMLAELHGEHRVLSFQQTVARPNPSGGAPIASPIFCLPKRESLILVSGYSVAMRAKIIDRWTELEEQARNPIAALSRIDLLKLALDSEEKRVELETRVAHMAPKVLAHDRIADAEGLMPPMNAAKTLQVQPKRLFDHMRTHGWTYRRAGARSDVAYQDKIAAGYLTHKVHVARREDGSEKVCEQVMVTPKGLTKLAQEMAAH